VLTILDLHHRVDAVHEDRCRTSWTDYVTKILAPRRYDIRLGILGKYAALRDAYASIDKAIEHATTHLSANVDVQWIDTTEVSAANVESLLDGGRVHGVIVPGGFGERGVEGKIACVEYVRRHGIPYLGICLGFQVAVIEFARHVLNLAGANSTEFDARCEHPVISELPEQKRIEGLGGTMRLGGQEVVIDPGTLAGFLFGEQPLVRERFRHRYEVDPQYIQRLQDAGLRFTGRHPTQPIMQVMELGTEHHPFFIGGQFHPELTSRPLRPQPMFMGLIAAAIARAHPDEPRERISRRWLRSDPPVVETPPPPPPPPPSPDTPARHTTIASIGAGR